MEEYQKPYGTDVKIVGGVIRLDPTLGVYLHVNSSHNSVGIESVGIGTDGSLEVVRDISSAVVSVSVTTDEYLTNLGVTVGLSGGGKLSKVFFYKGGRKLNLNVKSDFDSIASTVANIWFTVFCI